MNCPRCKSAHTVKCGYKLLASGDRKQRWQCMKCGRYFMGEFIPNNVDIEGPPFEIDVKPLEEF